MKIAFFDAKPYDKPSFEKYGKEIVLKTSVDPSIIGGMVLYVGNDMLDASVKAKFEGLKKQLKSIQI